MLITESVRKIRGYAGFVQRATNNTMKKNLVKIAQMNIGQLLEGKNPQGKSYEPYSLGTIMRNEERSTPVAEGDPIKLKDTGAFHEGIVMGTVIKKNEVEIKSRDKKSDMLEREYKPFGLTPPNLDKLTEIVYKDLYEQLKTYFK